jgi:hypothetical protein
LRPTKTLRHGTALAAAAALALLSAGCARVVDLNPENLPVQPGGGETTAPFICTVDTSFVLEDSDPQNEPLAPDPTHDLAWDGEQYVISRQMIPHEKLTMGRWNSSMELLWVSETGEISWRIPLDWCAAEGDHHCAGESESPSLFVPETARVGVFWHDHYWASRPDIAFLLAEAGDTSQYMDSPVARPSYIAICPSAAMYPDPMDSFHIDILGLAYVADGGIHFRLFELTGDGTLEALPCGQMEDDQELTDCRLSQSMMGAHHAVLSANAWGFVAAWKDYRHENPELYLTQIRLDRYAVRIGPEIRLTYAAFDSIHPHLAWNPTLQEHGLVWQDFRDGYHKVFFAALKFDSEGDLDFAGGPGALGERALTDANSSARKPRIAAHGPYYGAAWENRHSEDENAGSVLFALLDGEGNLLIKNPLPVAWMENRGREVRLVPLIDPGMEGEDTGEPYRFAMTWIDPTPLYEEMVLSEVSCRRQ